MEAGALDTSGGQIITLIVERVVINRVSRRVLLGVVLLALAASAAFALALYLRPRGEETAPRQGTEEGIVLHVLTRHSATVMMLAREAFLNSSLAKEHNIVDIRFIKPNPALWAETIERLGYLDVAWGGGPTIHNLLVEWGYIAPITDPGVLAEASAIPDSVGGMALKRYDEQGRLLWVASAISSFGIIYNEPALQEYGFPEPRLWEDLASPELAKLLPKPAIAFSRSTQSGSHTRIYQIILQKFGWEQGWVVLTRMAANGRPYGGSVEALMALEGGEVPIAIGIDFYGYTAQVEYPGMRYIVPYNESIVGGDPISLLVTSEHPDAALAFIRWVISVEGQKIWLDERVNRLPCRRDVFDTPEGKKRPDLESAFEMVWSNVGIPFNETRARQTYFSTAVYFDAVLCDPHDALVEAWSLLTTALREGKISQEEFEELAWELGKPLSWEENGTIVMFTEEYAASINQRIRDDPAFQTRIASIWREAAERRYKEIARKLTSD